MKIHVEVDKRGLEMKIGDKIMRGPFATLKF